MLFIPAPCRYHIARMPLCLRTCVSLIFRQFWYIFVLQNPGKICLCAIFRISSVDGMVYSSEKICLKHWGQNRNCTTRFITMDSYTQFPIQVGVVPVSFPYNWQWCVYSFLYNWQWCLYSFLYNWQWCLYSFLYNWQWCLYSFLYNWQWCLYSFQYNWQWCLYSFLYNWQWCLYSFLYNWQWCLYSFPYNWQWCLYSFLYNWQWCLYSFLYNWQWYLLVSHTANSGACQFLIQVGVPASFPWRRQK